MEAVRGQACVSRGPRARVAAPCVRRRCRPHLRLAAASSPSDAPRSGQKEEACNTASAAEVPAASAVVRVAANTSASRAAARVDGTSAALEQAAAATAGAEQAAADGAAPATPGSPGLPPAAGQQQGQQGQQGQQNGGAALPSFLSLPGSLLNLSALRQLQPPQAQPGASASKAVADARPTAVAGPQAGEEGSRGGPGLPPVAGMGTLWGLLVLSLAYLHHSTSGFALPALLPIISEDLHLDDTQGALLTAGYTVLYALALVPVGLLADRVDRPRLLAGGIALWSLLTMAAAQTQSFSQLLATRVGFAAAQATQNPICFSLIPEIFPHNRTTAMAVYNTAIYAGRALSFAALIVAGHLGVPQGVIGDLGVGYTLVPLDKVDLSLVSVLYTQGDYAAVSPVYSYALGGADGGVAIDSAFSAWRTLLTWLGPPGLLMAALALLTLEEPRQRGRGGTFLPLPLTSLSKDSLDEGDAAPPTHTDTDADTQQPGSIANGTSTAAAAAAAGAALPSLPASSPPAAPAPAPVPAQGQQDHATGSVAESVAKLRGLVSRPAFLALTLSAAFNDVGSWALVSWQATFYQRVYDLQPATYAPLLAVVIPVGGIIGGVGAGVFGDWLNRIGARGWLTAGACIGAAPLIAVSLLVPDYKQSFAALLVGFALSECWRAPAAVMVREVSPPGLGSTASAMHLCIRNLVGGLGPIAVALLSAKVGLQNAMLLVPACYLISGVGLGVTEVVIKTEKEAERAARHAEQQLQQ